MYFMALGGVVFYLTKQGIAGKESVVLLTNTIVEAMCWLAHNTAESNPAAVAV